MTLETQQVLTDERIWTLFDNFRDLENGKITEDSLLEAFERLGQQKTKAEITQIF